MVTFVYDRFDSFLLKLGCNMYLTSYLTRTISHWQQDLNLVNRADISSTSDVLVRNLLSIQQSDFVPCDAISPM